MRGIDEDIGERERAEAALRECEERLGQALEGSGQGTWEANLRTGVAPYPAEQARILGYAPGELPDEDIVGILERVHPEDREAMRAAFHAYVEGTTARFEAEFRMRTKRGDWKWILSTGKVVDRDAAGRPVRVVGTYRDIDSRKQAELKLTAALREKEILLREIHHRVKNNLQIISSLLHFQIKKVASPDAIEAFADLRRRLLAMSLVHEKLYESSGLALVDFGDYVLSLVGALASSFASRGTLRIDLPDQKIALPSESALPAGMILCELVTNVYKYAWPGVPGVARVVLAAEADELVLVVEDDGVGIPRSVDLRSARSFGWKLVRSLVAQLDGRFEVGGDHGTVVRVKFPRPGGPGDPAGVAS